MNDKSTDAPWPYPARPRKYKICNLLSLQAIQLGWLTTKPPSQKLTGQELPPPTSLGGQTANSVQVSLIGGHESIHWALGSSLFSRFLYPPLASQELHKPTQRCATVDRKSTRLNSSHLGISYAVFCLKKKE